MTGHATPRWPKALLHALPFMLIVTLLMPFYMLRGAQKRAILVDELSQPVAADPAQLWGHEWLNGRWTPSDRDALGNQFPAVAWRQAGSVRQPMVCAPAPMIARPERSTRWLPLNRIGTAPSWCWSTPTAAPWPTPPTPLRCNCSDEVPDHETLDRVAAAVALRDMPVVVVTGAHRNFPQRGKLRLSGTRYGRRWLLCTMPSKSSRTAVGTMCRKMSRGWWWRRLAE